MLSGLQSILEKQVVLATANSQDLLNRPDKIESEYLKHVETFIPMGDTNKFVDRLEKLVLAKRAPKGMIVAPYGYGKTSTLAFLWRQCEQRNLVAVPPFYCATFPDILAATYGWVKFRLAQQEPGLTDDLDALYKYHMTRTVDDMAVRYAAEQGIDQVNALGLLNSVLADGNLVLKLKPSGLLEFLDGATELVIRAGFDGLVVLADEFQQFLSKDTALRPTLQQLREFIWGLHTRQEPLSVVLSMPTFTEAKIAEQANDILARLKDGGLNYRLQDIYDVSFPARLWEHYGETFDLGNATRQVIDHETLRAIGQIAERQDLGEGPRTVIDSLKRAVLCYTDRGRSYTPVDLIEDFLESTIHFQSQTNKLKTVTRQALESTAADTTDKQKAIKLMAAFPRGCPVEVQKKYGLYDAVNALSRQAHGELMTHLIEGYTLLELSRTGGPTQIVDIIVTKFWQGYEVDEFRQEAAVRAFANHVLPGFFEQKRGTAATGWGRLDFAPSEKGTLVALIDGTYNPRFPRRRLALQIGHSAQEFVSPDSSADMAFDFALTLDNDNQTGSIEFLTERHMRFHFNVGQHLPPPLPDDLKKLQQLVNPEFITPLLMLSLVDYFDQWESREEQSIPDSDKQEIEGHLIGRLINHSVQLMFDREMADSISPALRRVGYKMIEELFNRTCQQLYADYHTFYVQGQHDKVINDYDQALRTMTLKERRGHTELRSTKENLARRFGLTSVSTFGNRIQSEYANLIETIEWTGRGDDSEAILRLKLHPLEEQILAALRQSTRQHTVNGQNFNALDSKHLEQLGIDLGYRDEELLYALRLLALRGYTRLDPNAKVVHLHQVGPDAGELAASMERLADGLKAASSVLASEKFTALETSRQALQEQLAEANEDEEELSEIETALHDWQENFDSEIKLANQQVRQELTTLRSEISQATLSSQKQSVLDQEIKGKVDFVMHLNELRQKLYRRRDKYQKALAKLGQTVDDTIASSMKNIGLIVAAASSLKQGKQELAKLNMEQDALIAAVDHLTRWIGLLHDTDALYSNLASLADLREQLTRAVVPEIRTHLAKSGEDALPDWEVFKPKIEAVEQELEKRRRHGNETFGEEREQYESFLRSVGIGEHRPMTRYTYGEDEESYEDLHKEVRSKVLRRLDEIAQSLDREHTDLLQAQYISHVSEEDAKTVAKLVQTLDKSRGRLDELRTTLTLSLIRAKGEELAMYARNVQSVSVEADEIRQALSPVLFAKHELTEEERLVSEALRSQQDIDLTELFVQLHKDDPSLKLSDLLERVESLYRKRQLTVRLRLRG